jgi:NAD(P)-dependent dehydrogenase (short-subunit alcohol dehydrogenase family)
MANQNGEGSSNLLRGKAVLVTGGGSGIGRAASVLFAREGAAVLVADINLAAAQATAATMEAEGGRALACAVDVADAASVDQMVATAVQAFGKLDGAFNNAGISGHLPEFKRMADFPTEGYLRMVDVNQTGVWNCMRAELRVMLEQGGGSIVNTASVAGARAFPGSAAYSATKHAVIGLTRTAAVEYARRKIRINAVLPGGIDTPMNEDMQGWQDIAVRTQPMRRVGRPEEIAEAACWLLSDRSSFVTAQPIFVDGGWCESLSGV